VSLSAAFGRPFGLRIQLRRGCADGCKDDVAGEATNRQPIYKDVMAVLEIAFYMGAPYLDRAAPDAAFPLKGIGYVRRSFVGHAQRLARLRMRGKMIIFPPARSFAHVVFTSVRVPVPEVKPCRTVPDGRRNMRHAQSSSHEVNRRQSEGSADLLDPPTAGLGFRVGVTLR
jgi:hypothetical protein